MVYIEKLKRIFLKKEFIIFILIGAINTMSSTVFSAVYALMLGEVQAFIPGYATGILVSYSLNTIFTFKACFSWHKLIKFILSTIPNFLIQFVVVYIGVDLLHINHVICYGLAAVIGVPVTFVILKMFVYNGKNN